MQLAAYQEYNAFLAALHDKKAALAEEDLGERFEEVANERVSMLNTAEGESLSMDDLSDIYIQVKAEGRAASNMSLNTRDKNGNIADYLESRRPFGSAQ